MDANGLREISRRLDIPDNELAEAIREGIFALMDRHEKNSPNHPSGEPCGLNRVGLIAWFAHSLGINREHADKLLVAIQVYDEDCQCGSPTLGHNHFEPHEPEGAG